MTIAAVLDGMLDRSVVLGYSRVGARVRRLWWPDGPGPKAMAGKRLIVLGGGFGGLDVARAIGRSRIAREYWDTVLIDKENFFQFNPLLPLTSPDWGFGHTGQYVDLWCGHVPNAAELVERAASAIARHRENGVRITAADQLGPALREALAADRPTLIQVPMENAPTPTPGHWDINDIYRRGE